MCYVLKECCKCGITGMTVGCVTDCGRSIFDVVLRFTSQSNAKQQVNRSASTDGDAGQL
jgi:hypothetical protein